MAVSVASLLQGGSGHNGVVMITGIEFDVQEKLAMFLISSGGSGLHYSADDEGRLVLPVTVNLIYTLWILYIVTMLKKCHVEAFTVSRNQWEAIWKIK